jgi:hypothetical protein
MMLESRRMRGAVGAPNRCVRVGQKFERLARHPAAMLPAVRAAQRRSVRTARRGIDNGEVFVARPCAIGAAIKPHELQPAHRLTKQIDGVEVVAGEAGSRYNHVGDTRLCRAHGIAIK